MIKIGQMHCAHFKYAPKNYDVLLAAILMLLGNICTATQCPEYNEYVLHELFNR